MSLQEAAPGNRSEAGRFVKGVSGNPNGRPKGASEIAELARSYGAEAIHILASIARDKDASDQSRIAAASVLLDRGYGRPIQPTVVATVPFEDLDDRGLVELVCSMAQSLGVSAPKLIEHEPSESE